ncbi:hypothetical protein [Maridesulfovibrio sp.]|uniref:hypothetical protein n=1 Tax=Maridesulfovibrio sp. TaxID=2795000 RepID=UPI002A18B524|nr:hypothetical protein [Maridesulfovibrio sp.]
MAKVYLNIDGDRLDMIIADFALTQKQVDAACKRAISKLSRHLKVIALRGVSQLTGVKQNVLKKRILLSFSGSRKAARIWFGQYPVPLIDMNPKQTTSGVDAGRVSRSHAFIRRRCSDNKKNVYRRVPERIYIEKVFHHSEAYGKHSRLQLYFSDDSFPQYPIVPQYETIDRDIELVIKSDVLRAFEEKFYTFFERELKWESKK